MTTHDARAHVTSSSSNNIVAPPALTHPPSLLAPLLSTLAPSSLRVGIDEKSGILRVFNRWPRSMLLPTFMAQELTLLMPQELILLMPQELTLLLPQELILLMPQELILLMPQVLTSSKLRA